MAGRKPIYDVKTLNIGDRLPLNKKVKRLYMHQYAKGYNQRNPDKKFKAEWVDERAFIVRVA